MQAKSKIKNANKKQKIKLESKCEIKLAIEKQMDNKLIFNE